MAAIRIDADQIKRIAATVKTVRDLLGSDMEKKALAFLVGEYQLSDEQKQELDRGLVELLAVKDRIHDRRDEIARDDPPDDNGGA